MFAYFDCANGISGDMTLGALIDLGADPAEIERQLKTMPLDEFSLERQSLTRCGIKGTHIVVNSSEHDPPHRRLPDIEAMNTTAPRPISSDPRKMCGSACRVIIITLRKLRLSISSHSASEAVSALPG